MKRIKINVEGRTCAEVGHMARVVYQHIEMVAGLGEVVGGCEDAAPIREIKPQSGSGMVSPAQLSGEFFCLV